MQQTATPTPTVDESLPPYLTGGIIYDTRPTTSGMYPLKSPGFAFPPEDSKEKLIIKVTVSPTPTVDNEEKKSVSWTTITGTRTDRPVDTAVPLFVPWVEFEPSLTSGAKEMMMPIETVAVATGTEEKV